MLLLLLLQLIREYLKTPAEEFPFLNMFAGACAVKGLGHESKHLYDNSRLNTNRQTNQCTIMTARFLQLLAYTPVRMRLELQLILLCLQRSNNRMEE